MRIDADKNGRRAHMRDGECMRARRARAWGCGAMSVMGVISTNYYRASKLLRPYAEALESIRSRGGRSASPGEVKSLLDVLVPLDRYFRDITHYTLGVNAWSMSEFLRLRYHEDWPAIRDGIVSVTAELENAGGGGADVRDEALHTLDYVEDALDNECESLYNQMRGR